MNVLSTTSSETTFWKFVADSFSYDELSEFKVSYVGNLINKKIKHELYSKMSPGLAKDNYEPDLIIGIKGHPKNKKWNVRVDYDDKLGIHLNVTRNENKHYKLKMLSDDAYIFWGLIRDFQIKCHLHVVSEYCYKVFSKRPAFNQCSKMVYNDAKYILTKYNNIKCSGEYIYKSIEDWRYS